jgi:aminopeptidase N
MLQDAASSASSVSLERTCFAAFRAVATTPAGITELESVWRRRTLRGGVQLSEADETALAAELALRRPPDADSILVEQVNRLSEGDRRDRLAFVTAALAPDRAVRREWFDKLTDARFRRKEAWVLEGLTYLNHPLRAESAEVLLEPALCLLPVIRQTGDIFFPQRWATAVLSGHRSPAAAFAVRRFLDRHADYPQPLRRVILQAADNLFRAASIPR